MFPLVYIVRKFEKEKEEKTMNYEKYMREYQRFIEKWNAIKTRNIRILITAKAHKKNSLCVFTVIKPKNLEKGKAQ